MNEDGTMARLPDLLKMAKKLNHKIILYQRPRSISHEA
jgi:3,4-dihydroxy-2-butanone 4-phosphate synthase